ncbi:hypothetical protein [Accumulibacter sp.]|uniref:hypothetical protein n=1 Tax=Accumulibacter sp. TaxID=2053492 RepID=UPI0028C50B1B|nr:hypothetical protein [Accumulibacter sp.]
MSRGGPLRTLAALPASGDPFEPLVVMLPGAYDTPEHFLEHGFAATLHSLLPKAGLLLVDCDLGSVADGSLASRLHQSVIAPARADGQRRLLLGGISIGALTALIHADEYPGAVDGLILIAPYPGNRLVTQAVSSAGSLAAWTAAPLGADEGELRGWRALQRLARQAVPPVWLGFGESDRFAPAQRMMAAALPPAHSAQLPGAHDWPTWAALWRRLLTAGPWR